MCSTEAVFFLAKGYFPFPCKRLRSLPPGLCSSAAWVHVSIGLPEHLTSGDAGNVTCISNTWVKEMQKPEDDLWKQVWAESVSTQDKESSVRLVSYSRNEWSKDMPRDEV